MESKKRKLNEFDNSTNLFDPSSIPLVCYELIFQYLPIESLISVSLTCKTWYNILCSNKSCFNENTKLILSNNENQLIQISNSKLLRHINKIEIGKYKCGLFINSSINSQFHFTSLNSLKLCFVHLEPSFLTNFFHCISPTLQKLTLGIQPLTLNQERLNLISSCLHLLSSLYLLSNLKYFFIQTISSVKIDFDIEKYFKSLTKLEKLIIRQDNYTWRKNRIQQLNSLELLPNLKYFEWFQITSDDLRILSLNSHLPPLQYIHLESTLITNEILFYLSKISTIHSLKSHRFSPKRNLLNINGFSYLLSLKNTLKELEISAKDIKYDELMMMQYPAEADCTEDEYQIEFNFEHINIFKQFIHLKNLSFNQIIIPRECFDQLLIDLAKYNNLKILTLESVCFPSFTILSTIHSLEELSLSYPNNTNREEYTDQHLFLLYSLKNLKVLILYHSINLSTTIRKQLKEKTLKNSSQSMTTSHNSIFQQLKEFIYNNDNDKDD